MRFNKELFAKIDADNGGLSYMSFDRDGDAGTAAATEAAFDQNAVSELAAIS